MTTTYQIIENLPNKVEQLIRLQRGHEAKQILEDVLLEHPSYSIAHYLLGNLYHLRFGQQQIAESHFRLAIKFGPPCPDAFLALARVLMETGRISDAEMTLRQGIKFPGINLAAAFEVIGNIYEIAGKYLLARRYYKLAIRNSLQTDFVFLQKSNLKRCRIKLFLF